MQVLENDLEFLRASAPVLEDYLLSDVLYYPVTGEHGRQLMGDTTRLTLGNLLLSIHRLNAASENQPDEDFSALMGQIDQIRQRWHSQWNKKIEQELPNRIRLWKNYLAELGESSRAQAGDYPYNVRLRVILELLFAETSDLLVQERAMLEALDKRLKSSGISGGFIWDAALEGGFPRDPFWYLYLHFQS